MTASSSLTPAGESITVTARTTALSQGRVVYYDGTLILGYADLSRSGQAELETRALQPGAHFIRAIMVGHPEIAARGVKVLINTPVAAGSANTIDEFRPRIVRADLAGNGVWESIRVLDGSVWLGSHVIFDDAPKAVATGDFNEDGHLDLLVATTSGLVVLAGDGKGGFANPSWAVRFAQPATTIAGLVVADFNEDGHPDVAVGQDGGVSIYFGDGKNGLGGFVRFADAALPSGEPSGDLNGDRHTDLLLVDSNGELRVLLGTGTGGFYPRPLELPGFIRASASSEVRLADREGTGVVDLIVVGSQRWQRDALSGLFTLEPNDTGARGSAGRGAVSTPGATSRSPQTLNAVFGGGFKGENNSAVALTTVQPYRAPENTSAVGKPASYSSPAGTHPNLSSRVITPSASTGVIAYTCDATINAVAGVCSTLNTTIADLYSSAFTNANANIYITFGSTGLGSSETALTSISYSSFRAALIASETDASDITAVTNSVPPSNPFGHADVMITNANARALGIAPGGGLTPGGIFCVLGTANCYDGIITVSSSFQSAGGLYYRNGLIMSDQYDFYSVVEHETDEILGTASCAFGCDFSIAPADLFRYHSSGTRSFAPGNNNSCASSNAANACFSLDGVNMLQQYNNLNNGEDAGDWAPNCALYQVQNSEACPGVAGVNISPEAEILVLDVVGFTIAGPSLTITKAHTGSFTRGQAGATYTITVTNIGMAPTNGTVTVTDTAPAGLTLVSMNGGAAWNCAALPTCTISNVLNSGSSYPSITVTANVAINASSPLMNAASVTGGGSESANTTDTTTLLAPPAAPVLTSPDNAATSVSFIPSLSWSVSSGATSYDVYFGTSSTPPFATNTTATSYNPGVLSVGTTYYWQVFAKNNAGSTGSAVWSFTTQTNVSKVGIFRSGFFWLLDVDGDEQWDSPPDLAFAFGGIAGDIPITGDWNGTGHTCVGIYRPINGLFILDSNCDGVFDAGDAVYNLGVGTQAGDVPVVGDWNGDGRTKVGLFRQGFFWILDFNGDGVFEQGTDKTYAFGGVAGDVPVVGDWTGTGTSKIGVVRDGFFWILDANGNGTFDGTGPGEDLAFAFGGIAGDVPVVGDWTGDGVSKVGMFRDGFFWVLDANDPSLNGGGPAPLIAFAFGGIAGDKPVVGRW